MNDTMHFYEEEKNSNCSFSFHPYCGLNAGLEFNFLCNETIQNTEIEFVNCTESEANKVIHNKFSNITKKQKVTKRRLINNEVSIDKALSEVKTVDIKKLIISFKDIIKNESNYLKARERKKRFYKDYYDEEYIEVEVNENNEQKKKNIWSDDFILPFMISYDAENIEINNDHTIKDDKQNKSIVIYTDIDITNNGIFNFNFNDKVILRNTSFHKIKFINSVDSNDKDMLLYKLISKERNLSYESYLKNEQISNEITNTLNYLENSSTFK